MIRFANTQDRGLVFDQRPWYVSGLNFVLIPWVPFFDPYNTQITRVDQWIRIPRLPWEFWEAEFLTELLKCVGSVVRFDQNTNLPGFVSTLRLLNLCRVASLCLELRVV